MTTLNDYKKEELQKTAEKYELDLIILFGSQAKNRATKESDLDIGIYRTSGLNLDDKINISTDFFKIFGKNNIDISIMSSYSPLLMHSILKEGVVLYEKENGFADKLKFYSWKLLAESKPFRDHSFSLLKSKIAML